MAARGKTGRRWADFALLAAPFVLLALLELSLRAYVALKERAVPTAELASGRIFCVGDSNVEGAGAPSGRGFPNQLEQRLRASGRPAAVVNLGRAGSNSTQALHKLERALRAGARPTAVLFLSGNNDSTNWADVDEATVREAAGETGRLARLLQRSRVFQLARGVTLRALRALKPEDPAAVLLADARWDALIRSVRGKESPGAQDYLLLATASLELDDFAAASDAYARFERTTDGSPMGLLPALDRVLIRAELQRLARLDRSPQNDDSPYAGLAPPGLSVDERLFWKTGRGWWLLEQGRRGEAAASFREAYAEPGLVMNRAYALEGLGWCRMTEGRYAEAIDAFRRALREGFAPTPQSTLYWSSLGYALAAHRLRRDAEARAQLAKAAADNMASPLEQCWMSKTQLAVGARVEGSPKPCEKDALPPSSFIRHHSYAMAMHQARLGTAIVEKNIAALQALAVDYGFRVFILTYPQEVDAQLNRVFRAVAAEKRLGLIDLEEAFRARADRQELISRDGYHPNEKGYGLIADEAARVLTGKK